MLFGILLRSAICKKFWSYWFTPPLSVTYLFLNISSNWYQSFMVLKINFDSLSKDQGQWRYLDLKKHWKWKVRSGYGHNSTQGRKIESFPILKKKEGTCKSDEWSLVCWREDWRLFPFEQFRGSKQCNQDRKSVV